MTDIESRGVTDQDIRAAYMKLWRSHKEGDAGYSGALLGPAIHILVASLHAEPVGPDLYRITDAGAITWDHMVNKISRNIRKDEELMEKAGYIVKLHDFLEELSDGAWHAATDGTSGYIRKTALEKGFVEARGATKKREYRITPQGQQERAVMPIETPAANETAPDGFRVVSIEIQPDWQQLATDRQAEIERLMAKLTDYEKELFKAITDLMIQDGQGWRTTIDYVHYLRDQITTLTTERDGLQQQVGVIDADSELRLRILDELRHVNPAIRRYIEARQQAEASLRQIVNG